MQTTDAQDFDAMFRAWDADRATGLAAACGIGDGREDLLLTLAQSLLPHLPLLDLVQS